MRHNTLKNRFGRTTSHRLAMVRNMVTNLFRHERMETTVPKAKEIRRHAERIITLGKRVTLTRINGANGDEKTKLSAQRVHAIRIAGKTVQDKDVLRKVFDELASRYETRPGGYTRILRKGSRLGDGTEMAFLELVDRPEKVDVPGRGKGKAEGEKKPRSENRPKKEAAPKKKKGGAQSTTKSSQTKGKGFDASRGRGGSRGS